jgi:hypothetical protein
MNTLLRSTLLLSAAAAAAFAQQWEFGGSGGGSFLSHVNVSGPAGTATAGFANGAALSFYVGGFSQYKHLGGELRYTFLPTGLSLKAGGQSASFGGQAHAFHYDLIFRTAKANRKWQLFAAVGPGLKVYRGTGKEAAYQPLYQYGYFTKTQQVKAMLSVGAGLRVNITDKISFRTELRDYMTQFPKDVLAPPPGMKYGSFLHDFVPLAGIVVEM